MTTQSELFLVDTNVVVHYVRASTVADEVESRFNLRHRQERPLLCVVSIGELFALTRKLNWGKAKREELTQLLRELVLVDISSGPVLDAYGEISHWTESQGRKMGQQNDIWIAAVAKATGAHLITTDTDFDTLHPEHIRRTYIDPRR